MQTQGNLWMPKMGSNDICRKYYNQLKLETIWTVQKPVLKSNAYDLPPVIYWVAHHRGPAGCAGPGYRCKTGPLWSGSPPVQSQQGERQTIRAAVYPDTWSPAVIKTNYKDPPPQPRTPSLKLCGHLSSLCIVAAINCNKSQFLRAWDEANRDTRYADTK